MRSAQYRLGIWWVLTGLLVGCARQDATAVEEQQSAGQGGVRTETPPRDTPRAGTAATSGRGGEGGAVGGGGRSGGSDGGRPMDAASDAGPVEFKLEVDAPSSGDVLRGAVTVRGRAPGFKNVEVWDRTHHMPPLARATPAADSTFSMTIDVGSLVPGTTTWTVYAWDSPAGEASSHEENVPLNLTIAPGENGATDPGTAYVPDGYSLRWSDEFDAGSLDGEKWNTLAPFGKTFYSDSQQKHFFLPRAVTLNGGIATLTAQRSDGSDTDGQPYSSGSITSNRTFTRGYYEARVKVPEGKGFWPAFWLTATEWPPEWDIVQIIDNQIYVDCQPRMGGACTFVGGAAGADELYQIPNLYGVFHVYGLRWTETELYFYVDGVLTAHYEIDAATGANASCWINLSLQVGGDKKDDRIGNPGDPDNTTPFPARMEVDYVRVYQR